MRISPSGLALPVAIWILTGAAIADDPKNAESAVIQAEAVNLGRPVEFERDVYPILESNCIACHNLAIDEGKLNLEEVELILKGGKSGPAVVPKEPGKSRLIQLASRAQKPFMPPPDNNVDAHALTPKQLGILRQWITEGAQAGMGSGSDVVNWQPLPSGAKAIYAVALSPWARYAAAGRSNQIVVYDLGTGQESARLLDPTLQPVQWNGQPAYPQGAAHRDFIHSLAFSPDGRWLASGGYRCVKLWQRSEQLQTAKLAGVGSVTSLAVSPDGKVIAVGAADNTIRLATAADGKVTHTLTGHSGPVTGLAFSPDGATLFSGSLDKTVRRWNLADGKQAWQFATPAEIRDLILDKDGQQVITAEADNIIRLWSANPPEKADAEIKPVREMKGHSKSVTSLDVILPAGTQILSGSEDGTARIWNLSNGGQVRSLNAGGPVTDVAARPDGQAVVAVTDNGIVKLWDMNGREQATMQGEADARHALTLANENKTVADQKFKLAEEALKNSEKNLTDRQAAVKTGEEAQKKADEALKDPQKKVEEATKKLEQAQAELAKKSDDKNLQKKVADAQTELDKQKAELKKATDAKEAADRSLDLSRKAVTQAEERLKQSKTELEAAQKVQADTLAQQQAAQKAEAETRKPLRTVAFSRDGGLLVTAGDAGLLQLWSAKSTDKNGQALETLRGHGGKITALALGPNDQLISGAEDQTAVVWDTTPAWTYVATLGGAADNSLDISSSPFTGRVLTLDFSPDGKLLAGGSGDPSRSGEVVLWDVEKRSLARKIEDAHSDTVMGLEFSRSGDRLVSCGADKFVKVFTVADGKLVRSFEGHTHHVMDVSWRADETRLASAGADEVVKVWNVDTGEQVTTITGFGKQVTSIQFLGTGDNVVTGAGDKQVRLHTASNRRQYRTLGGPLDYVYAVAASRDEAVVIAGGEDGVLRVWDGTNGQVKFNFEPPKPAEEVQATAAK